MDVAGELRLGQDLLEFRAAPTSGNTALAVGDGDGVPAEERAGEGEKPVGDGVAMEVLDEDEVAGDAGHFAEEGGALRGGEVVQEE